MESLAREPLHQKQSLNYTSGASGAEEIVRSEETPAPATTLGHSRREIDQKSAPEVFTLQSGDTDIASYNTSPAPEDGQKTVVPQASVLQSGDATIALVPTSCASEDGQKTVLPQAPPTQSGDAAVALVPTSHAPEDGQKTPIEAQKLAPRSALTVRIQAGSDPLFMVSRPGAAPHGHCSSVRQEVVDGSGAQRSWRNSSSMRWVLLPILLVLAACATALWFDNSVSRCDHFLTELSAMKEAVPHQSTRFWKLLRNPTIVHLNNTSPPRPLVIMLAAPPGATTLMQCIARKLAYAIDRNFNKEYEVHGKELKDIDGDEAKELLDVKLGGIFSEGNGVAIIHNLELLPAPSPLIFYSYCDDQNAAFKESAVIFTVQLPQAVPEHLTTIKKESFVTDFLKDSVWSGHLDVYGEARIAALLSRITPTVAIIQDEQINLADVCTETCPSRKPWLRFM